MSSSSRYKTHRVSEGTLRKTRDLLDEVELTLEPHAALLHRLWYKSRAQHRRSKWFQSIDKVRRNLKRTSSSPVVLEVFSTAVTINDSSARSSRDSSKKGQETSQAGRCRVAIADLWHSQVGERAVGSSTDSVNATGTPPGQDNPNLVVKYAALEILLLILQLDELEHSARGAYQLLEAHIRTPPAPTFAPLVMTLLATCAGVCAAVNKLLGTPPLSNSTTKIDTGESRSERGSEGLAELYAVFCQATLHQFHDDPSQISSDKHPLQLGVPPARAKTQMLNTLYSQGKQMATQLLPRSIERSGSNANSVKEKWASINKADEPFKSEDTSIMSTAGEDIGEAL